MYSTRRFLPLASQKNGIIQQKTGKSTSTIATTVQKIIALLRITARACHILEPLERITARACLILEPVEESRSN